MSAHFSSGAGMPTAVHGDRGAAAADPNQPPGLHGAGAEGASRPCPCCPDAAHICGVYPTRHWWVAQTKMCGQACREGSDLGERWGWGGCSLPLAPSLRSLDEPTQALGMFLGGGGLGLTSHMPFCDLLAHRTRGLRGAGAGGHRGLTACSMGDPNGHRGAQGGAPEPGVCDPPGSDAGSWSAGEHSVHSPGLAGPPGLQWAELSPQPHPTAL